MIAFDTNVLVRFITQDDPRQSAAATRLIDSRSQHNPGFITLVVMVELVWVLESSYRAKRDEITRLVEILLRSKELVIEQSEIVWQALRRSESNHADFTDCVIEGLGRASKCEFTMTFDRNAAAAAGMRLLDV